MSDKHYRFGVVGCGRVVQDLHLPAWALVPDARLVAACDRDPRAVDAVQAQHPAMRPYTSFDQFLQEADDLDFVVLATPGRTHEPLGVRLLERGLHLLCEKPLAMSSSAARALYEAAEQNGRILTPIHNYRFRDNVLEALAVQEQQRLGDVVSVQVRFRSGSLFNEPTPWMRQERLHQTLLFDFAYHFVDVALSFLGPVAELRFVDAEQDDVGLQYVVFGTRHTRGARGLFELMLDSATPSTEIDVLGERGALQLEFFPDGIRGLAGRDNPLSKGLAQATRLSRFSYNLLRQKVGQAPAYRILPHARLFQAFVDSLATSGVEVVAPSQVLETVGLLEAVARAAYDEPVQEDAALHEPVSSASESRA